MPQVRFTPEVEHPPTVRFEPEQPAVRFEPVPAIKRVQFTPETSERSVPLRVATGFGKELLDVAKMPIEIGKAFVTPPEGSAERAVATISGVGGLAFKRLLVDPQLEVFGKAREAAKRGETAKSIFMSVAAGIPVGGPVAAKIFEASEKEPLEAVGRGALQAILLGLPLLKGKGKAALPEEAKPPTLAEEPMVAAEAGKPLERIPRAKEAPIPPVPGRPGAAIQAIRRVEPIQTPQGPTINPETLERLRADAENIRQEGTVSEPLKPEMRGEARTLAQGKAGPAEQTLEIARQGFVETAEHLSKTAEEAKGKPGYKEALLAAKEQLGLRAEEFLLARRDPAMALRLLQEPLRTKLTPGARAQALKVFKESAAPRTEAMIELLKELKPGWSDMFYEAWINSLLSGPPTHVVNFLSNLGHRLIKIPERGIAGEIDVFRAKLTGTPRERFAGEMVKDTYGMMAGLQEGIRNGLQAWITEKPTFGKTRIELARPKAIPGLIGEVVRIPGRALLAADEFAKQINYSASIHAEAYRIAAMEGKNGIARAARMQELIEKPTDAMVEAAQNDSVYRTFQKELGRTGQAVSALRDVTPGGRLVLPFLRTLTNLPKVALEHTPLNFIRIAYKSVIQKHPDFKGGALSDELAKPVLGTMVGYLAYDLASRDLITGSGPSDPNERRVWLQMYQPNSVRVGDQWIQYQRLDPFSTHLGMAADLAEAQSRMSEREYEAAVSKMVFSFTENITSRTWATGLSDVLNAITEPDRYGARWIQRLAGSAVPTGVTQISRAISPEARRPQSVVEALKARAPGLAQQVEALRDIFGETVPRDVRTGPERMISPFPRTEATADAATQEMVRLKISMGLPSRKITVGREQRDMTREEYERFQVESGDRARQRINLMLKNPNWRKITAEDQEKRIRGIFDEERQRSRRRLVVEKLRRRAAKE